MPPFIFLSTVTPQVPPLIASCPPHAWNMAHPQLFSAALFLLVVCTLFPAVVLGNKRTAIFNKIADTSRDLQFPATEVASSFLGEFTLEGFMDKFEEFSDKQWGTPKATLDMDLMRLMQDVFVRDQDHTRLLQEAWGDPRVLRVLIDDLPIFDVIKPLRALREKKDTLTTKDVSTVHYTTKNEWMLNTANASINDNE